MQIHLKKGEKLYLNGAVLRVDRRASLEFLNDVTFLLEPHVMQAEAATTPLRQLYFIVQALLVEPDSAEETYARYRQMSRQYREAITDPKDEVVIAGIDRKIAEGRPYEALRMLRVLIGEETGPKAFSDTRLVQAKPAVAPARVPCNTTPMKEPAS